MIKHLSKLRLTVEKISWIMAVFGTLSLGLIIILITISVAKRELTGKDLFAVINIGELLIVITTFFGLAWTQIKRGHVSCGVIVDHLPKNWQAVIELIISLVSVFFAIILFWASMESAIEGYLSQETAFVSGEQITIWPFRWVIPIGVFFYGLVLFYDLYDSLKKAITKTQGKR